ncbi:GNAT family N-acetyltransferase [Streptomyces sp. ID05-04B]|uniref:GNAT family N-acetyltransferase n=1 Tax=unclassified Streptomyces TaxID=2593676 RepID=UPI000D198FBD|nr:MULTISPECIES: GNAT family N-acetyltransferase [unclassified Streptomyces]AVV47400.1 GNAT family N-acetyltransferase [Streptomyces sp. P3]MDX5569516.1 GNAT family N-acetyltransferase [Streptomyces sp. ID05-04B]
MYTYTVRVVRPEEWASVKALRLLALEDPAAPLAFLETYEAAAARPDSVWQERAAGAAEGSVRARQYVAEAEDGQWAGSVTVLVEEAGTVDWAGEPVERRQGHVVGVFVRKEWRGSGMTRALLDAASNWAWELGLERVRLLVHERNLRAQGAYRKAGFTPTGRTVSLGEESEDNEYEYALERPGASDR